MYPISNWPDEGPNWTPETLNLLLNEPINQSKVPLSEVIKLSEDFKVKFPVHTIQCKHLNKAQNVNCNILVRNINSTYPILHERVLELCANFILHKRKHGSGIEKQIYNNIGVVGLINRILLKRSVMFLNSIDSYLLLDGNRGQGKWETIGTDSEKPPLTLNNCISYDEIKLSALLYVTSYTYFINDGSRYNSAIPEKNRDILEDEGIIIGLIGARFEKENVMESQEILTERCTTIKDDSVAKLFRDFYQEPVVTYDDVEKATNNRYTKLEMNYFDNVLYAKRLAITIDTLLIEANQRAKEKKTSAFVHMVGIGLGVWKISSHQREVFMETFINRIQFLGKRISQVSDINFSHLGNNCGPYTHGDVIPIEGHPNGGVKVLLKNREPHLKLTAEDEGKLLVVTYAWDGNAHPGNEFWMGSLTGSGDPAAACSTQVAELHNAHINPKTSAENLHIATVDGVVSLSEYRKKFQK